MSFVAFCNLDGKSSWLMVVGCFVRKESRLDVLFNNGCVPFFGVRVLHASLRLIYLYEF